MSPQSVEATQEIHLEDIVELHEIVQSSAAPRSGAAVPAPVASSTELDDDDLLDVPAATEVMATLRVPALTLAQAMSALGAGAKKVVPHSVVITEKSTDKGADSGDDAQDDFEKTRVQIQRGSSSPLSKTSVEAPFRLPAPIWASISAAVAALVVGGAALVATSHGDDPVSVQVKMAEREQPQIGSKVMHHKYASSEQLGRWSEVPTFVPDVAVDSLPKR